MIHAVRGAAGSGYRPDIDGIRAIAVLLVVVFHFDLVTGVSSGFIGVDLFFVISGFLITAIVQRQLTEGNFQLGTFWMHRIRRLAPALTATTALTLLVGWLWLLPADFVKLAQQTMAAQLYYANIFYWRNVNYFGLQAHDVYLLHTWSLAVEEQFYILYPILLVAIWKWARGSIAFLLAAVAISSFGLNLALVAIKPEATFYLMPTRAWELLAGSLLALSTARLKQDRPAAAQACGGAGLLCLAVAVVAYRDDIPFPGAFALLPVAAAVLLILAGSLGANSTSRLLGARLLTYVGRISYPLYLVHWPMNVFAGAMLGAGYSWGWRLSMLALSVLLSSLIFHGIEVPTRRWLERAGARRVVQSYAAALVCALVASVFVLCQEGVPARFPTDVVKLAEFAGDAPPPMHECEYARSAAIQAATTCRLGSGAGEPKWFVYGDSHAWAASGAVDAWLRSTGRSAYFMFVHACPPVRGVYVFRQGDACIQFNHAALAFLKERPATTRVLLISTWRQAKEGVLTDSPNRKLSARESVELFDQQFGTTVAELRKMGKRVYIWEPLPGARTSVPQAMARAQLSETPLAIDFTREEYLADYAFFFDLLNAHGSEIEGRFSPYRELCGSGNCATSVNGVPLYFDNAHLTYSQRGFWAAALARQMPKAGPQGHED